MFSAKEKKYTYADYTVACICPMGVEAAAVRSMFDKEHPRLSSSRDHTIYICGQIGPHNVVVAIPSQTGTNTAAAIANQLANDFRSVRFGLLVGIAGGIPDKHDIRLGDVVVSKSTGAFPGVVQFDFIKQHAKDKIERTGSLNNTPALLGSAVEILKSQHRLQGSEISNYLSRAAERYPKAAKAYRYPGAENDKLFKASYRHRPGLECGQCDQAFLEPRSTRNDTDPQIHYGIVASSNTLVRDVELRTRLAEEFDALCVEMEAAGVRNDFPCLVIRGICDYADSHKHKDWQPYAAAVAAAYMAELLGIIPAAQIEQTPTVGESVMSGTLNQSDEAGLKLQGWMQSKTGLLNHKATDFWAHMTLELLQFYRTVFLTFRSTHGAINWLKVDQILREEGFSSAWVDFAMLKIGVGNNMHESCTEDEFCALLFLLHMNMQGHTVTDKHGNHDISERRRQYFIANFATFVRCSCSCGGSWNFANNSGLYTTGGVRPAKECDALAYANASEFWSIVRWGKMKHSERVWDENKLNWNNAPRRRTR